MRLQYLKLENITSLKGIHHINFSEIGKQSDLFAITGPTGSGKSTLLMAIAMALYGQNHKGLNAADLVTTQCPYGKIELQFTLHGKAYKVLWSCQTLKKDGSPRKVALTQRHWYIDEVESQTDAADVIGLSWDQFTKVIILNQGQFSEFLTSTFNKRKEILEKLMGHGQLEILGKNLRRKLSELESEINSLQGQSDFAKIMTKEEYDHLVNKHGFLEHHTALLEELTELCQSIENKVSEDIKLKEKKLEISQQFANKTRVQEELQKEMALIQAQVKKAESQLQEHQKTYKEKRPFLKEARENIKARENAQLKKDQIEKSLSTNKEGLKKKKALKDEKSKELTCLIHKQSELEKNIKQDTDITSIQNLYKDTRNLFNQLEKKIDSYNTQRSEKARIEREGQESKNNLFNEFKEQLGDQTQEKNIGDREWSDKIMTLLTKESYDKLRVEVEETITELSSKAQNIRATEDSIKTLRIELQHITDQLSKNKEQLSQNIAKTNELKSDREDLENKLKDSVSQHKLISEVNRKWKLLKLTYEDLMGESLSQSEEMTHSHIEGPCPICSNDTVSWDKVFAPLNDSAEEGFKKQEKIENQIKEQQRSIEVFAIQQAEHTKNQEELKRVITELESNHKEKQKDTEHLSESIIDLDIEKTENLVQTLQKLLYELDHFIGTRAKLIQQWKSIDNDIKYTISSTEDNEEELQSNLIKLSEFAPTLAPLQIEDTILKVSEELISDTHHKLDEVAKEIEEELKKQTELRILSEKKKSITQSIDELQTDLKTIQEQSQRYQEEEKELSTHLSTLENTATAKGYPSHPEEELEKLEQQLEESRAIRDLKSKEKIDIDTRYRQGSEQINNLGERLEELEKLHILYREELRKNISKLREYNEVESYSKSLEEQGPENEIVPPLFLTQKSQWESHLEKYTAQKWDDQITQQTLNLDKQFLNESVGPQAQRSKDIFISLKQKSAATAQEIKTYNEQQERIAELAKKISAKKSQWEQFEVLNHYIGKDKFRDFALTILENTLLDMANQEIESLAEGRYELLHAKAGKRSEFMVKDHWHGGNERKVSTLSGGETFLLSLGLAMGLSDITRGQTEIESFFIDEGFGTLDDESIGQVLDCLMAIQSRGKQIGLISHVTSLTSQIPIRLEVTKNNFGESTISIN